MVDSTILLDVDEFFIYFTPHLIIWTAVQPSADLVRSVATQRRKGESLGGASWTAAPWVRPQSLLLLSCTTPLEWVLSRSQLSARSSCLRRREGNREVLKYSYYEEAENIFKITCKWLSDHLNSTVTNCFPPAAVIPLHPPFLPSWFKVKYSWTYCHSIIFSCLGRRENNKHSVLRQTKDNFPLNNNYNDIFLGRWREQRE